MTDAEPSTLTDVAPLTAGQSDNALEGTVAGTHLDVPRDAADGISITSSDGRKVGLGLPFASGSDDSQPVKAGVVAYDNNNGSLSVPVTKTDGTLSVNTVITDATAPTAYAYPLDLPTGSYLQLAEDGGVVALAANGDFMAGFAAPWAKDANGTDVATHFEVRGTTLVQIVNHANTVVAYPVVADPWLFIDLVKSVKKVYNSANRGWTYQVVPTAYGRAMPEVAIPSGFKEAVKKGVLNKKNLSEQYACHPLSIVARVKSSWNLDVWRPQVGLAKTILARCNP